MPNDKNDLFPLVVAFKSCPGFSATIYKTESTKNGKAYTSYVLSYHLSGKRVRKSYADLAEARQEAERAIALMSRGEASLLEFGLPERQLLQRVQSVLADLPGVLPDVALLEYVQAVKILKGTGTLYQAAEFYMKHHDPTRENITVAAAVEKLLIQQTNDNKSEERLSDLKTHLSHFAGEINCEVSVIDSKILSDYLSGLKLSERSKANRKATLAFLNKWLIRHNYLARGTNWMEHVQAYKKVSEEEVEIFTPGELRLILENVSDFALPYFAIAAFTGIRHAEIFRLDWSQVNLAGGFIVLYKGQTKKKKRRLPPIRPVLREWLLPHVKASGPVADFDMDWQLAKLKRVLGRWKANGLRHSYISYRLAEDGDINMTSHEAGNSPRVIDSNYKHVVMPDQSKAWFEVYPTAPGNVTTLPTQATLESTEAACSV